MGTAMKTQHEIPHTPCDAVDDFCMITLADDEREAFRKAVEGLPPLNIELVDDELLTHVALTRSALPERLLAALIDFRRKSNEHGAILVRNLPVDPDLPATPKEGKPSKDKRTHFSEFSLLALMMCLGEPIAYEDEKEGVIIQDVCPVKGKETKQENTGSVLLKLHTEDGFHPHKPDYIGLICLRPDHENVAATLVASIRRALSRMPASTLEILRRPLFSIQMSSSFLGNNREALYSRPIPVLSGDLLEPDMCMDNHAMVTADSSAKEALDSLSAALREVAVGRRLSAGEMLIVDNRGAAHARTGFEPHYDGNDRWLQRLFVVEDFRRSRRSRAPGSHVCASLATEYRNEGRRLFVKPDELPWSLNTSELK